MRVITGTARGKRLKELEGMDTRPTTDRVKESLFSAIQFDVEGRRVLDLFAGSATTSRVAQRLERNFIGVEEDPTYVSKSRVRLKPKDR